MRILIVILLLLSGLEGLSQSHNNAVPLVAAERSFAATAKEKTTRHAFLTFLADSGVVFQPGPVNGKNFWSKTEDGLELLSWMPAYVYVSSSGDLGYSTGPWEFRTLRTDSLAAANGYFVSVWKKYNAEWKVALDIGISFPLTAEREAELFEAGTQRKKVSVDSSTIKDDLLGAENKFIADFGKTGNSCYQSYTTSNARFYRPGRFPFITDDGVRTLLKETGEKVSYKIIDGAVAEAVDLGYVYGKVETRSSSGPSSPVLNGNYLRIWKKENGQWKIALDLIHLHR